MHSLPPLSHRKDKIIKLQTIQLCVKIPRDWPDSGVLFIAKHSNLSHLQKAIPYLLSNSMSRLPTPQVGNVYVLLRVTSEVIWKGPMAGHSLCVSLLFPLQIQNTRLAQERLSVPSISQETNKCRCKPKTQKSPCRVTQKHIKSEILDSSHWRLFSSLCVAAALLSEE